jgi:hypothetical protein
VATYLPASKYVWNQWIQTPPIYSIDPGTGSGITITANNTWTTTVAATTTTSVYSMNAVWNNWVTSNNYTPTLTWQDDAWNAWVEDEGYQRTLARRLDRQQAKREQRSREQLAAEQQQAENRIVAHARALDLLDVLLTDEERAGRAARQRIEIVGSDGQLYWIETHRQSVHGNIVRTDEHGCMLGRACVAPGMRSERGALPTADGWIGQYLGLKLDAVNFLSHANWSGIGRCRVPAAAAAPEAA